MTFVFHKYKVWWKSLSQMKLLSINNHSLTYKVTPHCAECVFLLFFVINALEMLQLPVPVHVQSNTNKNVHWAWLLRKSVFVVLGKKGTMQAEKSRYPEQGNTLHCEILDSVLDCASGDNGKALWRRAEPPASSLSMSGFWFIWSQGWPLTQVCTAWLHSLLPPHYQQPQWRECSLTEGQSCPGLDFQSDIKGQSTMWERLGWHWATEVPLLLAVHQQRAVVFCWHGETASMAVHSPTGWVEIFYWVPSSEFLDYNGTTGQKFQWVNVLPHESKVLACW